MKWFRVYSEIKDDPKMLEMDDHQRWLWICLMSLANDSEQRGTILNAANGRRAVRGSTHGRSS